MGDFGDNLRRERERQGVSLQKIAGITKIGTRMLDALETERFDRLPGGLYNRQFIAQYARCLGLDERQVLADFDNATGSQACKKAAQIEATMTAWRDRVEAPPKRRPRWLMP